MILRDFLYLDRALVRDFLAQLEGGAIDERTERETISGKGGIGAKVGTNALGVSGEKTKERALETQATVRQVASSEFDRLYSHLEAENLTVLEEIEDDAGVALVRRKHVVEIDARVRVSPLHQVIALANTFVELAPLMQQMGTDISSNPETQAGLAVLMELGNAEQTVPIIASVTGSAGFKIALELDPSNVLADGWDVDATILMKVQRLVRGDEAYVVGDPFGGLFKFIAEPEQQKFLDLLKSPELVKLGIAGDSEVRAPGAVGTPIAIYR